MDFPLSKNVVIWHRNQIIFSFLSTPTKQSITFFKKMFDIGLFIRRFLWYNMYLVCFLIILDEYGELEK